MWARNAHMRSVRNREGSGVANSLNPVRGPRDALARHGIKPKNHHKENMEKLRATQKQKHEKKMTEEAERAKAPFKMNRFQHVAPKVKESTAAAIHPGQPTKEFLHRTTAAKAPEPTQPYQKKHATVKPAVPKKSDCKFTPSTHADTNYVGTNLKKAVTTHPPQKKAEAAKDFKQANDYGRVPQYVLERKHELDNQKEQRRMEVEEERKHIPPGMRQMGEQERQATLTVLNANLKKFEDELSRFPIVVETISAKRRRAEIEGKIKEIEDAIRVFSRPKVFVKLD